MNVRLYVQYLSLYLEMSIKEGIAKETLIGLASIRYGCSNLYRGAILTFFSVYRY